MGCVGGGGNEQDDRLRQSVDTLTGIPITSSGRVPNANSPRRIPSLCTRFITRFSHGEKARRVEGLSFGFGGGERWVGVGEVGLGGGGVS